MPLTYDPAYWALNRQALQWLEDEGIAPDMGHFRGAPIWSDAQVEEVLDLIATREQPPLPECPSSES